MEQGADYAVQSSTKWINGHSDATGGTVSGSAERIRPLHAARVLDGAILGPFEAWLTLRGLRTLAPPHAGPQRECAGGRRSACRRTAA